MDDGKRNYSKWPKLIQMVKKIFLNAKKLEPGKEKCSGSILGANENFVHE